MSTVLAQARKRATCDEQAWAEDWFSLRQRSNSANSPAQSARIFLITGLHEEMTRNEKLDILHATIISIIKPNCI